MIVLSYGYKKPEPGDRGSIFFPAMEENIQRMNDHSHNGIDSAPLSATSIASGSVTALAAAWVLVYPGKYKQSKSTPPGFTMNSYATISRLVSTGQVINPTIDKTALLTFDIYSPDNTVDIEVQFR
jgi:hypothetical protein